MQTRMAGAVMGVALSAALVGCGSDKTSDVTSATAQECKAELRKIFDQSLATGQDPELSEDNAPEPCKNVADDAGEQIVQELTQELGAEARAKLDAVAAPPTGAVGPLDAGAGLAGTDTSESGATSAGPSADAPSGPSAPDATVTTAEATSSGAVSVAPSKLPVGNGEWRLEKANLEVSSFGTFGGTVSIRYLGTEPSILSETIPSELVVYQGKKKVGTLLFTVGAPDPGELKVAMVISEDDFVKGPYTFLLRFE